jgi:hypothetical protein
VRSRCLRLGVEMSGRLATGPFHDVHTRAEKGSASLSPWSNPCMTSPISKLGPEGTQGSGRYILGAVPSRDDKYSYIAWSRTCCAQEALPEMDGDLAGQLCCHANRLASVCRPALVPYFSRRRQSLALAALRRCLALLGRKENELRSCSRGLWQR